MKRVNISIATRPKGNLFVPTDVAKRIIKQVDGITAGNQHELQGLDDHYKKLDDKKRSWDQKGRNKFNKAKDQQDKDKDDSNYKDRSRKDRKGRKKQDSTLEKEQVGIDDTIGLIDELNIGTVPVVEYPRHQYHQDRKQVAKAGKNKYLQYTNDHYGIEGGYFGTDYLGHGHGYGHNTNILGSSTNLPEYYIPDHRDRRRAFDKDDFKRGNHSYYQGYQSQNQEAYTYNNSSSYHYSRPNSNLQQPAYQSHGAPVLNDHYFNAELQQQSSAIMQTSLAQEFEDPNGLNLNPFAREFVPSFMPR